MYFKNKAIYISNIIIMSGVKEEGENNYECESHTLDIPYGEDIYNMENPENYRYGVKMW